MNSPLPPDSGMPPRHPHPDQRILPAEPMFNVPSIVTALAGLLAAIHILRQVLSPETDWSLIAALGFVPARLSLWLETATIREILEAGFGQAASTLDTARLPSDLQSLINDDSFHLVNPLTYGLLHGSWGHLATNSLWLVAFGSPVARRLGSRNVLLLLCAATMGGALAQWLVSPLGLAPLIGASAGVSGATAAAARFVFADGIRYADLGNDRQVRAIPVEPLLKLITNPRALTFIAFWFGTNILFGSGIVPLAGEDASIAWQAHIGGFLTGLLLFPALDRGAR
jgi:membrane associated rhomboid family serine protease